MIANRGGEGKRNFADRRGENVVRVLENRGRRVGVVTCKTKGAGVWGVAINGANRISFMAHADAYE